VLIVATGRDWLLRRVLRPKCAAQAEKAVRDAEELLAVFRKGARSSVANAEVIIHRLLAQVH
jgi:hypothetical protein